MNDLEFKQLVEESWRRSLTMEEESTLAVYLAGRDAALFQWEEEMAVNRLLSQLADAPVSTNFTARVLHAVQKQEVPATFFRWFPSNWLPRIGIIGALVGAALLSIGQYRASQRAQVAHDIAAVSRSVVPQEWLQDFEAINRLSQPPVDEKLLAALR
ncbi:MAG: hypothetical protein ABI042_11550 [Verrucomicrobiota bacterium]